MISIHQIKHMVAVLLITALLTASFLSLGACAPKPQEGTSSLDVESDAHSAAGLPQSFTIVSGTISEPTGSQTPVSQSATPQASRVTPDNTIHISAAESSAAEVPLAPLLPTGTVRLLAYESTLDAKFTDAIRQDNGFAAIWQTTDQTTATVGTYGTDGRIEHQHTLDDFFAFSLFNSPRGLAVSGSNAAGLLNIYLLDAGLKTVSQTPVTPQAGYSFLARPTVLDSGRIVLVLRSPSGDAEMWLSDKLGSFAHVQVQKLAHYPQGSGVFATVVQKNGFAICGSHLPVKSSSASSECLAGQLMDYGGTDGLIIQFDANGNPLSSAVFGGTGNEFLEAATVSENTIYAVFCTASVDGDLAGLFTGSNRKSRVLVQFSEALKAHRITPLALNGPTNHSICLLEGLSKGGVAVSGWANYNDGLLDRYSVYRATGTTPYLVQYVMKFGADGTVLNGMLLECTAEAAPTGGAVLADGRLLTVGYLNADSPASLTNGHPPTRQTPLAVMVSF